jgi:mono/diheme cytochrome c family protein
VLEHGRERYNIYCQPCHGDQGAGNGMVVQRGMAKPPDYIEPRLINSPVGHFYDVITNGYGSMYSYADRVPPRDRWAIAAYIRVLQRSRAATLADVPADSVATCLWSERLRLPHQTFHRGRAALRWAAVL